MGCETGADCMDMAEACGWIDHPEMMDEGKMCVPYDICDQEFEMDGDIVAVRCDESMMYDAATVIKAAYFTTLATIAFIAF